MYSVNCGNSEHSALTLLQHHEISCSHHADAPIANPNDHRRCSSIHHAIHRVTRHSAGATLAVATADATVRHDVVQEPNAPASAVK